MMTEFNVPAHGWTLVHTLLQWQVQLSGGLMQYTTERMAMSSFEAKGVPSYNHAVLPSPD